jgi:NAD(P)-dependent dehydrogenase (short-subunit alcohol dehydrogenase family)
MEDHQPLRRRGDVAPPRFCLCGVKGGGCPFTETLAHELAGTGIDVNDGAGGPLNTRLLDDVLEVGPERAGRLLRRALKQKREEACLSNGGRTRSVPGFIR